MLSGPPVSSPSALEPVGCQPLDARRFRRFETDQLVVLVGPSRLLCSRAVVTVQSPRVCIIKC